MKKRPILFTVLFILIFCCLSYASGPTDEGKRTSVSSSKELSQKKSSKISTDAEHHKDSSYNRVAEPKSMPAHLQRQKKVRNGIDKLIKLSRKGASDICREIKRMNANKKSNINNAEIKNALDIADQLDKYVRLLQKNKKLLKGNGKDINESLRQTLADMSQMDMLKLQDAMNSQSQLMQMMSNIQKIMNDTSMGIIRNMK